MKTTVIFLLVFFVVAGCGPVTINKPVPGKQSVAPDSVQQLKTALKATAIPDSSLFAFGNLYFGMKRNEVIKKNENRQHLGKYDYNFRYAFNGDSSMYQVVIYSDGVQVLGYDTSLKALYRNLAQIVETRYGTPVKHNSFPSVFDVQNAGKYLLDQWMKGNKQIDISLHENAMNSYSVLCEITHKTMAEAEKNKDLKEAARKF